MTLIEVTTEQMSYGGHALARHEGRVLFVPYALPGERVRVRLPATKKRWAKVELLEVLAPSPERIEPRCPHFGPGRCGGCHWQHARYEAQLQYKQAIVIEQLERIGKIERPPVAPCLGMEVPWFYRNHVQLRHGKEGLGFVREDNQGLYPIDRCFIMNHAIYPLFEQLLVTPLPRALRRVVLRGSERTGERLVLFEGAAPESPLPVESAQAWRDPKGALHPLRGEAAYEETLGGRCWRIGATSFFQVNTVQAEVLLDVVRTMLPPLRGDEVLVDAYAGAGLFGLSLAEAVGAVYLIESHPAAAADARRHAAGMAGVTVIEGASERVLAAWGAHGPAPDLLLLDPPRAGCEASLLEALGDLALPTIIYVSCDPATQARDLRRLLELGYHLDCVQPVDLFPHTYHIESVARLHHSTYKG